jgi:predicted flap endonuclease-1-like 5' DNA nuclease
MDFTSNQWAILALVLVLGWILGLLSRKGAGPLRKQLRAEEARRIAAEHELATARTRIGELERARAVAPAVAAAPGRAAVPVAGGSSLAGTSTVAGATGSDDLTRIGGIDAERAQRLESVGIYGFRDLEALSDTDAATVEHRTGLAPGTIAQEGWREQAADLRSR